MYITINDMCKCPCMEAVYQDYIQYIKSNYKSKNIYEKIENNESITQNECQILIEMVLLDLNTTNIEIHSGANCYTNNKTLYYYKNCQLKQREYEYQEYDDYGPVGEAEEHYITCLDGFVNTDSDGICDDFTPRTFDIVIITFFLNLLSNNRVLYHIHSPFFNQVYDSFYHIEDFCKLFNIYFDERPYIKSEKEKITFHRFKGFEYYFKKIFNYSPILESLGVPIQHQQQRNINNFQLQIYGHPKASHGLCYESMKEIESLYE